MNKYPEVISVGKLVNKEIKILERAYPVFKRGYFRNETPEERKEKFKIGRIVSFKNGDENVDGNFQIAKPQKGMFKNDDCWETVKYSNSGMAKTYQILVLDVKKKEEIKAEFSYTQYKNLLESVGIQDKFGGIEAKIGTTVEIQQLDLGQGKHTFAFAKISDDEENQAGFTGEQKVVQAPVQAPTQIKEEITIDDLPF